MAAVISMGKRQSEPAAPSASCSTSVSRSLCHDPVASALNCALEEGPCVTDISRDSQWGDSSIGMTPNAGTKSVMESRTGIGGGTTEL